MAGGGGESAHMGAYDRPAPDQQSADCAHALRTGLTQFVAPARHLDKLVQRGDRAAHFGSL